MELEKKSGSNNLLKQESKEEEQCEKVIYRIKSDNKIQKFPTLRCWTKSTEHVEIYPEGMDGRESIGMDSDNNPDVIDVCLSGQYSASQPDDTVYEGDRLFSAGKSDSTSSSSSSSSIRSSDDLFQVNVDGDFELKTSSSPSPQDEMDIKPALDEHNTDDMISRNSSSSEETENYSPNPASMSSVVHVANESSMPVMSPTQPPPTQVMDRPTGYDPSRIPDSAFDRSSSITPQEWSAASNDSLFSIRLENASFAKQNAVVLDIHKSGELKKSSELPPTISQSPSFNEAFKTDIIPNLPSIPAVEIEKHPEETIRSGAITTENPEKSPPVDPENNGHEACSIHSNSCKKSEQLDKKGDEASPLPEGKKRRCFSGISWSILSCGWPSCSSKSRSCFWWPTFCFKWPNCWCCMSSAELEDGDKEDGSKPKEGEGSKKSSYCCCTKPVCCNCMKPVCF